MTKEIFEKAFEINAEIEKKSEELCEIRRALESLEDTRDDKEQVRVQIRCENYYVSAPNVKQAFEAAMNTLNEEIDALQKEFDNLCECGEPDVETTGTVAEDVETTGTVAE